MKIVITGSLGNIGKPLTESLVKNEQTVAVISSSTDKQNEIQSIGATAAIGSLQDGDFLNQAFANANAVFCMIPPSYTVPDQMAYYEGLGENYKKAIVKNGIKRVIHLSSYGAHHSSGTGFITGSYLVEQILNSIKDIELTHLRPTSFYYNLLTFIPMIKTAGFMGGVYGGTDKLAMVSPKDIAKTVAEETVKISNTQTVRYVGSDDKTCQEVATILGQAIGKPDLKWINLPKEDVYTSLIKNGLSEEYAEKIVELGEAIHTGKLREDYDLHTPQLGKVKVEDFAIDFANAYNAK